MAFLTNLVAPKLISEASAEEIENVSARLTPEQMDALNRAETRRIEAAKAQPKKEEQPRKAAPANPKPAALNQQAKAARILRAKGHREAAQAVGGQVSPREVIVALEAAMRDKEVPGGIRFGRIKPLLNEFDDNEARDLFTRFMKEVAQAAFVLNSAHLAAGQAFSAQAALRRAAGVRFEGRHMASIERMLVGNSLPDEATRPLADYPQLAEAVPSALAAEPRRQARTLLTGLTNPLWAIVKPTIERLRASQTRVNNPKSGFSGAKTGKTARKKAAAVAQKNS